MSDSEQNNRNCTYTANLSVRKGNISEIAFNMSACISYSEYSLVDSIHSTQKIDHLERVLSRECRAGEQI